MRILPIFFCLLLSASVHAQSDTIFNQKDASNMKQGFWKKSYPNGKLMYKGYFKDDKPVGEMRRYFESGRLKAILHYDENNEYSRAVLYYENGKKAAEGNYYRALKDSVWNYFSYYDNTLSGKESYNKGKRHGMMTNYFSNGDISEKLEWKDDKKSGLWEQFFNGNVLKTKANYVNDQLEGEFVVYTIHGKPYITGNYENNLREGKWLFYNEDGTIQNTLNYRAGKAAEEEKLSAEQQEFFRAIDGAQGKFNEPDETDFLTPQGR